MGHIISMVDNLQYYYTCYKSQVNKMWSAKHQSFVSIIHLFRGTADLRVNSETKLIKIFKVIIHMSHIIGLLVE
jgi:hypothetical protein